MVDQKCFKVHISAVIPPLMKIFFSVYYSSTDKESKSDILHKFGIQLGSSNLRWIPGIINFYKVVIKLFT